MLNTCHLCGVVSEELHSTRIFKPSIHKWTKPGESEEVMASIYDDPYNTLPVCPKCLKATGFIPPNGEMIKHFYATDEEKAELLKIYDRLKLKISAFNTMLFEVANQQHGECFVCGTKKGYTHLTLRRRSTSDRKCKKNAVAVCVKCTRDYQSNP